MPLLCPIKNYAWYNYILEDADPKYKRIFIENQAYNTGNLIPRKEFFHWQSTSDAQQTGANFYEFAPCDVDGKFGTSWSDTRTAWYGGIGKTDPWLLCLDYNFNPRRIFYSEETDCLYINYYRDISTTDIRSDWWIGKDMTNAAIFSVATNSYLTTPLYKLENSNQNKQGNSLTLICFNHDNTATNLARLTFTPGAAPTYTNIVSTNIPFFIGNDDAGAGYFLNYNLTSGGYDISVVNVDVDIASNTLLQVIPSVANTSTIYQFPSNLKHDSDTRKVFYAPFHQNTLNPVRIVWDKASNRFDYSPCTKIFPGITTWDDYFSFPTGSNYTADASNNWWMKFHVFKKSGNNYITLCTSEKCIHNFSTERWNASQLQRNWITFSIGSGENDNVLTYHSTLSWPTAIEMPRAWVPTDTIGNRLIVMQTGKTVVLDFNTANGWQIINTQSIDARSYAIDSTGRIYLNTRGQASAVQTSTTADNIRGNGWNETFLLDPNLTIRNVNLEIANTLQEYSGNTVETYMQVSADNKKLLTSYGSVDRFNPTPVSPFANNYSLWFQSANSDRITSSNSDDFNFRTGDFTIEFWIRSITAWTSQTASAGLVGQKYDNNSRGWQVYRNSSFTDKLTFRFAGTTEVVSTGTVDATIWQHWAIVRNSGVITLYRDGVSSNTITSSADIYDYTGHFMIGLNQAAGVYYNGYISNLRICKGLAVYTGNFTVPTSPLTKTQSSDTNISSISTQCVFLGANSDKIVDNRPFESTSLQLYSLTNNLKFNHGLANLTNEITVSTLPSEKTNVAISIIDDGPIYVKVSNRLGPSWITPSGQLGNVEVYETETVSYSLSSTGDEPITYSFSSGTLPSGITFNSNTATISGNLPYEESTNTYSFIIRATDVNGFYTSRQFSITNNIDYVTWNNQSTGNLLFFPTGTEISYTLNATSVLNDTIMYSTSNTLPNGISITGNTISGNSSTNNFDANVIISAYSTTTQTRTNVSVRIVSSNTVYIIGGTATPYTESGQDYNYLIFESSATLSVFNAPTVNADILLVGGGGGGGTAPTYGGGGGGGGGGLVNTSISLENFATYTVAVGSGGTASTSGSNTYISLNDNPIYLALGGGAGSQSTGGSGGGAAAGDSSSGASYPGSAALQPSSIWGGFGNAGGTAYDQASGISRGGGGGGAGAAGGSPYAGAGKLISWVAMSGTDSFNTANTANVRGYFAGGGGGGTDYSNYLPINGGVGGGGYGTYYGSLVTAGANPGGPGIINTGGAGGGSARRGSFAAGGTGGSGILVIRYKLE